MAKKRTPNYEKKLNLKPEIEFSDLIGVALQPPKEQAKPKAKRATGKKK
ncbi:MAG: hypothetical protein WDN75_15995 [Bacteroidota bacterium]